jgi:hypothetical protein
MDTPFVTVKSNPEAMGWTERLVAGVGDGESDIPAAP